MPCVLITASPSAPALWNQISSRTWTRAEEQENPPCAPISAGGAVGLGAECRGFCKDDLECLPAHFLPQSGCPSARMTHCSKP